MKLQLPTPAEMRLDSATPMRLTPQHAEPGIDQIKYVHTHPEGQFFMALQGVIVCEADGQRAVLPPGRLGWVPPNLPHGAAVHGNGAMQGLAGYTIHLAPEYCHALPTRSLVLRLSTLARAVIARMCDWPNGIPPDAAALRLMQVFLDEIVSAEPDPLNLTMPRHPRLLEMAVAIADNPADETDLDAWAQRLGFSRRSITRHFRAETGMSLVEWRQIARLQRGMQLLAAGDSVTSVAIELGYDSVSSFIALFRRILGTTPARFVGA